MSAQMSAQMKERLLPHKGAEFEVCYFADGEEVTPFKEPHDTVSAVSTGLKVTVLGRDTYVAQNRQDKPFLHDGHHRTMLVVRIDGVWLHLLGEHLVVSRHRYNVGQVVQAIEGEGD